MVLGIPGFWRFFNSLTNYKTNHELKSGILEQLNTKMKIKAVPKTHDPNY